jgi:dissimilatory sulfite reductase (desulfoviridin) alpha/beta subunit
MVVENGGSRPCSALRPTEHVPMDREALEAVERVVSWLNSADREYRVGKVIEERGLEVFRKEVL